MAFILFAKRIVIPNTQIHPLLSRFFSSSSPTFSIVDYLITTFGIPSDKAARVSKPIAHLRSPENPDAVHRILKQHGFTEGDIKRLITWQPKLLLSSPEKTIAPTLSSLRGLGLSTSALNLVILSGPTALHIDAATSRIKFWMDFFGGDEAALVKAFSSNRGLVGHDLSETINPKISLLHKHGLSSSDIKRLVLSVPRFITANILVMEDHLRRAKELGFHPESGMFVPALHAVLVVHKEAMQKKMELLMSYGWSEDQFHSALQKTPRFVISTDMIIQEKIDFLMAEARCDPCYIASHPVLLTLSLEKRLKPRLHVLNLLESKGICYNGRGLVYTIKLSNTQFLEKFILPHKEDITGLHESFQSACA